MWRFLSSPVVAVQLVNVGYFLSSINRPDFYFGLVFGLALHALVVSVRYKERLKWQRDRLDALRKAMAARWGLTKLLEIQKDDWDVLNGPLVYSKALSVIGLVQVATLFFEGRYFSALNLFLTVVFYVSSARTGDGELILFTGRFNVVLQFVAAASYGTAFGAEVLRRMLLLRCLAALAFLESIEELFCHIVVFPSLYIFYRFGWNFDLLSLPWVLFVVTVTPAEIMGMRLWLLRKVLKSRYVSPSSYVASVVMIVPFGIAMTSFGSGKEPSVVGDLRGGTPDPYLQTLHLRTVHRDAAIPKGVLAILPYLGLLASGFWFLWGSPLDEFIRRITENPGMARTRRKSSAPPTGLSTVLFAAWMSALAVLGVYGEFMLVLAGVLLFLASRTLSDDRDVNRSVFLLYQALLWRFVDPRGGEGMHIFLACSRLWLCFKSRAFSDILAETLFISSFQALFSPSLGARRGVLGVSSCGLLVALALLLASENLDRFLNEVKAADSFLDHAIKQRLAALGSVMRHALDASEGMLDELAERTLAQAIFETQLGLAACHLSSAALRFESGNFSASLSRPSSVVRVLRSWGEDHDVLAMVAVTGEESVEACLDWDLLRSLVIDMMRHHLPDCLDTMYRTRHGEVNWPVRLFVRRARPGSFTIRIESRLKEAGRGRKYQLLRNIRETVSRALGGSLSAEGDEIEFPVAVEEEEQTIGHGSSSSSSLAEVSSETPHYSASRKPHSPFRMSPLSVIGSLPIVLGGQGRVPAQPPAHHRPESAVSLSGDLKEIPRNLIISALDDNSLVRISLVLTMRTHLQADMRRSFITGATKEEALQFPQRIIEAQVHIALFDENLEYDDDDGTTLKGSTLATRAKQMGFRGCLVLHSANAALAESLDPCFDGFLEKTLSKDQFLRNIARVYDQYLTRTLNAGHSARTSVERMQL